MFDHVAVEDGEELRVGNLVLRFLETPGHTPESISIVLYDTGESAEPDAVLTGDTLFIGGRGEAGPSWRPDACYRISRNALRFAPQQTSCAPDSTKVYPAHGAGSMCGRNISKETSSTIGEQRRFNYALQPMSRDAFVRMMTTDLPEAPAYFSGDVLLNREGPMRCSKSCPRRLRSLRRKWIDCTNRVTSCWTYDRRTSSGRDTLPVHSTSD